VRSRLSLAVVLAAATASPAAAEWLVYFKGGIQETRGAWEVRGARVLFTTPSGTLSTIRAEEVDLAASAFLSWQVGQRRAIGTAHPPAGAELRDGSAGPVGVAPCVPAKVAQVLAGETLDVEIAGKIETVHLAGVDAPEADHRTPELAWLGERARAETAALAPPGARVCVADEVPPLVDRGGHRIVYVALPGGADLGAALVARGLGLARGGAAARRATYLELERAALGGAAGAWGELEHDLSVAIVPQAYDLGGSGKGAAPPRRPVRRRG
jgi:endonuclease YncB( thermonuclease family)